MPKVRKLSVEEAVAYFPKQAPVVAAEVPAAQATAKAKTRYRVRNRKTYNQALVQRGSLTFWLSDDVLAAWQAEASGKRGHPTTYADAAIECLLLMQSVYHLPLCQTEGFARSIFALAKIELPIPDYSTLARRRATLDISLPVQHKSAPMHVIVDSSGLKIYGDGEWMVRQHRATKRRTWRKIHLAIDEATQEIVACITTERQAANHTTLPTVLDDIKQPIGQVSADGGYDYNSAYLATLKHQATPVFPPRVNATVNERWHNWASRNGVVKRVKQIGLKAWKQETNDHRRSLAETGFFRLKTIFGERLGSRRLETQQQESRLRCVALNRMTRGGMPQSYKVVAALTKRLTNSALAPFAIVRQNSATKPRPISAPSCSRWRIRCKR